MAITQLTTLPPSLKAQFKEWLMMKLRRMQFIVAALLLMLMCVVPVVTAYQNLPCFDGEGCPEPVNPEPDEYYMVQCTINAVRVWVAIPSPLLVTSVSFFQIDALNDGASLVVSNNVRSEEHTSELQSRE